MHSGTGIDKTTDAGLGIINIIDIPKYDTIRGTFISPQGPAYFRIVKYGFDTIENNGFTKKGF